MSEVVPLSPVFVYIFISRSEIKVLFWQSGIEKKQQKSAIVDTCVAVRGDQTLGHFVAAATYVGRKQT
jgi:hypothetical protein